MIDPPPSISVLMSVFNGEKYLARALMSILIQTFGDFELIVIDDGSTDASLSILESVHDSRISLISQENQGLTKSLNKAIKMARGKWIARHDADDFSISTRFEKQMAFLQMNNDIRLLGSNCFIQPEILGIVNEVYSYPESHDEIVAAFTTYNPFVHGSTMIDKELMLASGGYNEGFRYVQDYELWSRLITQTRCHNLATPLYVRSIHEESSQVQIKKEPIFIGIRDRFLETQHGELLECSMCRPIESISLYPVFTQRDYWNKSISNTLYRMSNESRKHNLPWLKMRLQSKIYCPFGLSNSDSMGT